VAAFRFDHEWSVPAEPDRVYAALADLEQYAVWWPQVRTIERVDDDTARTTIRSVLPYTLSIVLTRSVQDDAARRLRVTMDGDLRGWSQWQLQPTEGGGTVARFTEEVDVTPGLLRWAARAVRPLLVANHTRMMVAGERALRAFLRE
jgi:uncharacterized protein YndB with AHSA1/START domain